MTRLNPLDASWLYTESRETPMHVGALMPFELPEDAPPDFMQRLMAELCQHREFAPPWNRRLATPFLLKNPLHRWVEADAIDLEAHVRHSALPWPGGERELGELIGRLHGQPLDLSRPPWECTLIEGLSGNRFAIYVKMHHSLIDGVSGMKLLQRALPVDPHKSLSSPPFWAVGLGRGSSPERDPKAATFTNAAYAALNALRGQAGTVPQLLRAFGQMLRAGSTPGDDLRMPFGAASAPSLNGRVRGKRRFATQTFELARIKALATAAGCTVNDVVLATCGGALRRFLEERGELPDGPLTAGIPVSVRPKDDDAAGNAITFIIATLGTDIADPLERLAAVRASVQAAKAHVQALPRDAMTQYTVALMGPTILALLTGLSGRTRPVFNITISNVPGPEQPLYFRGAKLLGAYPASIVTHGQALNITCQSYAGQMDFGFTGCHENLPHLQRIAVYAQDAFEELERAVLKPARKTAAKAPRKSSGKAAPKAPAKAQRARKTAAADSAPAKKATPARRARAAASRSPSGSAA